MQRNHIDLMAIIWYDFNMAEQSQQLKQSSYFNPLQLIDQSIIYVEKKLNLKPHKSDE